MEKVGKGVIFMDVDAFVQLVNGVGFPIAACSALFWFLVKQNQTVDTLATLMAELKTLIKERLK